VEQLSLADAPPIGPCRFPNHTGTTGYRYGCRCPDCRASHGGAKLSPECQEPGCLRHRLKHRRYCAEHIPEPQRVKHIRADACAVCEKPHHYYESKVSRNRPEIQELYRTVCAPCRKRVTPAANRYHFTTTQAMRYLTATRCDCCGERFPLKYGKPVIHVDHDHRCCDKPGSCGACVTGFVCEPCNRGAGQIEALARTGRGALIIAYLTAAGRLP
jgi:hypothetical protein